MNINEQKEELRLELEASELLIKQQKDAMKEIKAKLRKLDKLECELAKIFEN